MTGRRRIGAVDVAVLSREDAMGRIAAFINDRTGVVGFCNAHTVNLARADAAFAAALAQMLVLNDGAGIDLASKLLYGGAFPDNLNGTDLTPAVLAMPGPKRVFLLGSPPGVADLALERLATAHPHLQFVGAESGYFAASDEAALVQRICAAQPDLLLVGMGQPRQEMWAARHRQSIGCTIMCVGAYLDFAAGRFRRAPDWVQAARLEWVWRLMQEPRRLANRYIIGNATFIWHILVQRSRA